MGRMTRLTKRRDAGPDGDAAQLLIHLEAARIALRRIFEGNLDAIQYRESA